MHLGYRLFHNQRKETSLIRKNSLTSRALVKIFLVFFATHDTAVFLRRVLGAIGFFFVLNHLYTIN